MMLSSALKEKYIEFCTFSVAVNKTSALRLAFWDGTRDIQVRPKEANSDVLVRGDSSDLEVLSQIYIQKEYGSLVDMRGVDLVVDAGANVGYSSVYFLSHFPDCHVVAVEPDPANFAALKKNLAPYGDRATLHNCGIWSKSAQLAIESNSYRDGREWTRQVRECAPGERGDITAITIAEILQQSGRERLSLLKMDIEGAEAVVFADEACQEWLNCTDAFAIELHDDTSFGEATNLFHKAISHQNFQINHCGELTIGRRV
jgi:FkbM family methyltransferase